MAEFLPSSLFAFVWTKDKVGVNITVILTEQLHGQKKNQLYGQKDFFCGTNLGNPKRARSDPSSPFRWPIRKQDLLHLDSSWSHPLVKEGKRTSHRMK